MSKPKLPDQIRRVTLFGRVKPPTKEFLKTIPEPNEGRAVDKIVETYRHIRGALMEGYRL